MSITSNQTAMALQCVVNWLLPSTIHYPDFQKIPTDEEVLKALEYLAEKARKNSSCHLFGEQIRQAWAIDGERVAAISAFNQRQRRRVS